MSAMKPQNPGPVVPPEIPSEGVRGLISLFLIVHLFAIGVTLAAYASGSEMQRRLISTMRPYVRTFNFDLTHVFPTVARLHLTHAGPSDVDFVIRGESKLVDGKLASWQLPRSGLVLPVRWQRDQALANVVGGLMDREEEEQEAILPRAMAAAELRRASAKSGTITVTAHYLQNFEDLENPETRRRDPMDASYYQPVFEARVIASLMGGVDLLKKAAVGEVAPVTRPTGSTGPARNQKDGSR